MEKIQVPGLHPHRPGQPSTVQRKEYCYRNPKGSVEIAPNIFSFFLSSFPFKKQIFPFRLVYKEKEAFSEPLRSELVRGRLEQPAISCRPNTSLYNTVERCQVLSLVILPLLPKGYVDVRSLRQL